MKVIAVQTGFFGGARRRAGEEFEIDESTLEKDIVGEPILPPWVHPAEDQAGAKQRIQRIQSKPWRAAIVASGAAAAAQGIKERSSK